MIITVQRSKQQNIGKREKRVEAYKLLTKIRRGLCASGRVESWKLSFFEANPSCPLFPRGEGFIPSPTPPLAAAAPVLAGWSYS